MRSIKRRSNLAPIIILSVAFALLVAVGGVGTLWALGKFPFSRVAPFQPSPGSVPVLLSVKAIPAYTRITRDHLFQVNGEPKLFFLTPDEVKKNGILTDFNTIVGRVVTRNLKAGFSFREQDFFPRGTRDGIAGGTPPGKRSLTLDATRIAGVTTLKAGDAFDLVASYVNDVPKHDGRTRPSTIRIDQLPGQKKYALSRVIVQKGVVIQPVTNRTRPKPNSSVAPNGKLSNVNHQEIVIAVAPAEVAAVTQALLGATELRFIHRSGHKDEDVSAAATPETPLPPPDIVIETMRGGNREYLTFPAPEPMPPVQPKTASTSSDAGISE